MTKYILFFALNLLLLNCNVAQSYAIQRGHSNDDLYIFCRKNLTSSSVLQFYHLSEHGSKISVQYTIPYPSTDNDLNLKNFVADPTPGMLFCTSLSNADTSIYKSTDYGKSWQHMTTLFNGYTPPIALLGGSVPGEIIMTERLFAQEYGIGSTTDFFETHINNASYNEYFTKPEVGITSGELYGINNAFASSRDFLLHSTDFGVTIDTIPIDSTVVYNPNGNLAQKLCHGTLAGEIYLATQEPAQTGFPHVYKIYHSVDFGDNFELRSSVKFDESSAYTDFSGSRDDCSFYVVNWKFDQQLQRQIMQVFYSADCGLTFTLFEHDLDNFVSIDKPESTETGYLSVSPNPAGNQATLSYKVKSGGWLKLTLTSADGKQCETIFEKKQPAGNYTLNLDCNLFPAGVYILRLSQADGSIQTCKLLISR